MSESLSISLGASQAVSGVVERAAHHFSVLRSEAGTGGGVLGYLRLLSLVPGPFCQERRHQQVHHDQGRLL